MKNIPSFHLLQIILGITISILFIVLGLAILFNFVILDNGYKSLYKVFALIMIIYGFYRGLRVYWTFKRLKATNE